jgi:hypothetical protein
MEKSFVLKGILKDNTGNILPGYTVKAFDKDPFSDDELGQDVTKEDGTFRINFSESDYKEPLEVFQSHELELYLKVYDLSGDLLYKTGILAEPSSITQTKEREFEAIVIGTGFGGTIVGLSYVNKLADEDKNETDVNKKRKVCFLERGQWWISHEVPTSPAGKPGMGIYLESNDIPYRLWTYPDNLNGLDELANNTRIVDRRGLYDYRMNESVDVIAACGVGGGSLVYTNVTEAPDKTVLDEWDSQLHLGLNANNLKKYFDMARGFIGVNKITTNAATSTFKLPRTIAFQNAAEKVRIENPQVVTNPVIAGHDIYAVDLSITDIPYSKDVQSILDQAGTNLNDPNSKKNIDYRTTFGNINNNADPANIRENIAFFLRKYSQETNVCERQGRCALGCIPGARHTNNKKLFDFISNDQKKDHIRVYPLCEAFDIEPLDDGSGFNYKIYYFDYNASAMSEDDLTNSDTNGNIFKMHYKLFEFAKISDKSPPPRDWLIAKKLFLAAGSIGSTELLLKSRDTKREDGNKLQLSDKLGLRFSTNGDLLGVVNRTKTDVNMTRGPIVTSAIKFNTSTGGNPGYVYTLEDSGLPKMFAGISGILSDRKLIRRAVRFFGNGKGKDLLNVVVENLGRVPGINLGVQIPESDLSHVMLFSGMGKDLSDGRIKMKPNWKEEDLSSVEIDYDLSKLKPLFEDMIKSMKRLSYYMGEKGESSLSTPFWDSSKISESSTMVLHPLGGSVMAKDSADGVVDIDGKVFKGATGANHYNGLYVVDGAIIPTALGVNSSLTISALAFMIAAKFLKETSPDPAADSKYLPVEEITIGTETQYLYLNKKY